MVARELELALGAIDNSDVTHECTVRKFTCTFDCSFTRGHYVMRATSLCVIIGTFEVGRPTAKVG